MLVSRFGVSIYGYYQTQYGCFTLVITINGQASCYLVCITSLVSKEFYIGERTSDVLFGSRETEMRRPLTKIEHAAVVSVVEGHKKRWCPDIAKAIAKLPWVARCRYRLGGNEQGFVQIYMVLRHDGSWGAARKEVGT